MSFASLKSALQSPARRVERLRVVIDTIRASERLDHLPDTIAEILTLYDSPTISPALRADIQELFASSIELSKILLNPTFNSDDTLVLISNHQQILSKLLHYLAIRPSREGYSLLITRTGTLVGQFSTREEADRQLQIWHSIGQCPDAVVTPVKITSTFAIRPEPDPARAESRDERADEPIPNGIRPTSVPLEALERYTSPDTQFGESPATPTNDAIDANEDLDDPTAPITIHSTSPTTSGSKGT